MATKERPADGAQSAEKKVRRRGVSNATKAVAQLRFHEKDAAANGLFVGHLEEVRVDWSTNEENADFPGVAVPRLTFHFASNHTNPNEKRHVYQTLFAIPSNVETIPGGDKEWRVNNVLQWIKHILDVFYLNGRELTEEEEDALAILFMDYDDDGNFVPLEIEEITNGYCAVFEAAAAMLNGQFNLGDGETAKPCFKTGDGKFVQCWLKLLRCKKVKNEWKNVVSSGDLAFDGFIGSGCVELLKPNTPASILRIDYSKESITPKEIKKTPTIGAGVPGFGGVVPPTAGMPGGFPNDATAMNEAGDGVMPF